MYPLFFGFPLADLPGSSNSWIAPHSVSGWSKWPLRAGYPRKAIVLGPDRLCDRLYMNWLLGSKSFLRGTSGQPTPCPPWTEPGMQWVKLDSTQVLFCHLATRPYIDHCVQFWELYVGGLAFKSQDTCPAFHPGTLGEHQIVRWMQITVAVVLNMLLENVSPKRPFQKARGLFGAGQGPLDDSNIPPKSTTPNLGILSPKELRNLIIWKKIERIIVFSLEKESGSQMKWIS